MYKYRWSAFMVACCAAGLSVGCTKTESVAPPAAETGEATGHQHGEWWCDEHGVPEEICAQCSIEVANDLKAKGDWCKEHERPDSQCFICHPEREGQFAAQYEAKYGKKPPKPHLEGEHHEGDGHDHSKDGAAHDDHEHAHLTEAEIQVPADFPAAVARIKVCNDNLRAALKAGDVHKAHEPVDELVVLAGKLTSIARDSGVPKANWKDINLLAKELDEQLDSLHAALDRDESTGYDTIGPKMDAAITQLETLAAGIPSSPQGGASTR